MQSAVNPPQSKSVTIAYMALKLTIFSLIITSTAKQMSHLSQIPSDETPCSSSFTSFASIIQIFNLLGCILDVFCLIYFFCQDDFRCMEYYVFFAYHVVLLLVATIGSLTQRGKIDSCDFQNEFFVAVGLGPIVFMVSAVVAMWSNLYFSLKYAHFGSNIVWFCMWFTSKTCDSALVTLVALIHGILSVSGLLLFLINRFLKKTSFTAKVWRAFTFISLISMVFCYAIILLGLMAGQSCPSAQFFKKIYQSYGLLEIVGPVLVLLFLKSEQGDPRQKIIKNHNQVFQKLYQHEHINLQEKQ